MPNSLVVSQESFKDDRRKFPRIPIHMPVQLLLGLDSDRPQPEKGLILDISPKGFLLKTEKDTFKEGQELIISPDIELPEHQVSLKGKIRWKKSQDDGCLGGVFIKDSQRLFLQILLLISKNRKADVDFMDSMLDTLAEGAFLVDSNMRIMSLSRRQPLVPVDRDKARGQKLTEIPSILKLFSSEQFNLKQDLQEVLYTKKDKHHRALALKYGGAGGEQETHFYNICYKYMNCHPINEAVLIQVRDVTALYKLKNNIERKNKSLFEQYRFTLMGHIVDELLEDIISPLSAVVGRIDLLKMKMAHQRQAGSAKMAVDDWLLELETIDGLVDQITQHCTVAAKRREREKLGAFQSTISLNKLVQETVHILSVHERFRRINVSLDLKRNLPHFEGDYFDWLNALIALIQHLSREMQTQNERHLKIETLEEDGHLVLSVSHNAKALKMPLERETGFSIFDLIQKKYDTVIEAVGGNGYQKISFYIKYVP